jgi:hexulose-6-phosphate isomerase
MWGVIQGRLSRPINGRIQAFPGDAWEQEFSTAKSMGLDYIEWVFDLDYLDRNPLASEPGLRAVQSLMRETGVQVYSVCADYFMRRPLFRTTVEERLRRIDTLVELIERSATLEVKVVVLPCVDESELRSPNEQKELIGCLYHVTPILEKTGVQLALETSLAPSGCRDLMTLIDHPQVRITYDIGNSASFGYDPGEEVSSLAPWISHVHVKDRVRGGVTVPLGTGDADLGTSFRLLHASGYAGGLTLQGARQTEGEEHSTVGSYLCFAKGLWEGTGCGS